MIKSNKKSRRNPSRLDKNDEFTPEAAKELKGLISKQLDLWRKQNSGESFNPEALNVFVAFKKELNNSIEGFIHYIDETERFANKLHKLISKFSNDEKIEIPKFDLRFD